MLFYGKKEFEHKEFRATVFSFLYSFLDGEGESGDKWHDITCHQIEKQTGNFKRNVLAMM